MPSPSTKPTEFPPPPIRVVRFQSAAATAELKVETSSSGVRPISPQILLLLGGRGGRKRQEPPEEAEGEPLQRRVQPLAAATPTRPGLVVLRDPTGRDLGAQYELSGEPGRGEFVATYMCTVFATGARYACKSISKRKLRTPVDVEDVRWEVDIMRHMPAHPNIVSLRAAYEDEDVVHLVMEFCEGWELFDRIAARGHYTERPVVTRTIVEVVQRWNPEHGG